MFGIPWGIILLVLFMAIVTNLTVDLVMFEYSKKAKLVGHIIWNFFFALITLDMLLKIVNCH